MSGTFTPNEEFRPNSFIVLKEFGLIVSIDELFCIFVLLKHKKWKPILVVQ